MASSDSCVGTSPAPFDLSFLDIFGTFAAGGELHLVSAGTQPPANKLADFHRASELTNGSRAVGLAYLAKFDVVRFNDFPALKRLLWCGEVCRLRRSSMDDAPASRHLHHLYGLLNENRQQLHTEPVPDVSGSAGTFRWHGTCDGDRDWTSGRVVCSCWRSSFRGTVQMVKVTWASASSNR